MITDLAKIYNEDMKYSGELYDVINSKLQIFYDYYHKINLPKECHDKAFSIMLKGRASSFYYDKITRRNYDFSTIVTIVRAHFETEENRQLYMSE